MLFMNMRRKYQNAAGGEGGEGGGQGGQGGGENTNTNQPPAFDYAKLADEIIKRQGGKPENKPENKQHGEETAFDRIRREEEQSKKGQTDEARIRADVAFDLGFNTLIESNAAAFGVTAEAIRKGVGTGLEGSKQVEQLKVTAARAFLAIPANLALLSPADKAFYESQVQGRHDAAVDADKTWTIVERALHVKAQLDYQNKVRGGGSTDANKGKLPNMDAYIKRCIARCRPKTNQ